MRQISHRPTLQQTLNKLSLLSKSETQRATVWITEDHRVIQSNQTNSISLRSITAVQPYHMVMQQYSWRGYRGLQRWHITLSQSLRKYSYGRAFLTSWVVLRVQVRFLLFSCPLSSPSSFIALRTVCILITMPDSVRYNILSHIQTHNPCIQYFGLSSICGSQSTVFKSNPKWSVTQ